MKMGTINTDLTNIKTIIRENWKQLNAHKFYNLDEMKQLLKNLKLPGLPKSR